MFIEKYTFYLYSKAPTLVFRINVVVGINVFWENFVENIISVMYQINMLTDFLGHALQIFTVFNCVQFPL